MARSSRSPRNVVIVGHGPSVLCGLGAVIDSHKTVIRLKHGLTNNQPVEHFGTRTDIICARSHLFAQPGIGFWLFPALPDPVAVKWLKHYWEYGPKTKGGKPSTGLCAVFMAMEYLKPKTISLIGFDRVLNPQDQESGKWFQKPQRNRFGTGSHDQDAEGRCLRALPVRIINMAEQ